jgi:hypothetical protein
MPAALVVFFLPNMDGCVNIRLTLPHVTTTKLLELPTVFEGLF